MNAAIGSLSRRFAHNRIFWSRIILVTTLFIAIFSDPPAYLPEWGFNILELVGFALLAAATLWRVWCLVFIGGTKDGVLSTTGPYSVVRNPLYIGSFVGITGFGLAVGLPTLAASLAVIFGVLYPAVVAQEEMRLQKIFGEPFTRYCEGVPRWIPDWSLYQEPAMISVSPARVRQGILDGMWYLWAFALSEVIEIVHQHSLLPHLF
jgi:protein-S-isoprenylcysteine O-methyltransferase Ste14